jgi:hypothetical protein
MRGEGEAAGVNGNCHLFGGQPPEHEVYTFANEAGAAREHASSSSALSAKRVVASALLTVVEPAAR